MKLDLPIVTPIQMARKSYLRWKSEIPFEQDFQWYLENAIVISRPDIFAMAKVVNGELFVRMAVGNLRKLLTALPVLTPTISFCRRNEPTVRRYSLAKLLDTANKLTKKG